MIENYFVRFGLEFKGIKENIFSMNTLLDFLENENLDMELARDRELFVYAIFKEYGMLSIKDWGKTFPYITIEDEETKVEIQEFFNNYRFQMVDNILGYSYYEIEKGKKIEKIYKNKELMAKLSRDTLIKMIFMNCKEKEDFISYKIKELIYKEFENKKFYNVLNEQFPKEYCKYLKKHTKKLEY